MPKYRALGCDEKGISQCVSVIKSGGVVVFPTDTIYGIGCDPYSNSAVERVFKIKGRDENKPLPVLVYSLQDAEKIVTIDKTGRMLAEKFWPGALTITAPLVDKKISRRVTAGIASLAVRVPANSCTLSLLKQCRYLVGTSANLSGEKSSKSAEEIIHSGLDGFDILLDGGTVGGVESTIVDMTGAKPRILREGAIKSSEVFNCVGST